MSYSRFSTSNAEYWLVHARHDAPVNEIIFDDGRIKSLDAIVLEDCGLGSAVFFYDTYAPIVRAAKENNVNLYTMDIDVNSDAKYEEIRKRLAWGGGIAAFGCCVATNILKRKKKLTRRGFLALGGGFLASLGIFGIGYGLQKADEAIVGSRKEASGIARKAIALETEIFDTEVATLRNAVNAKKAEEFLSPMLMQKLGRKPKIAMVYGSLHAGMQDCILDRESRDEIIASFSGILSEYRKSETFEKWLNNVYEFVPVGYGFDVNEYDTNLF
ncbi:MAG: hypothetical protein QME12_08150 [Nanoarchaeota archaeon]|nr:hypothetical protein [Nanoarchaeota archaeon]